MSQDKPIKAPPKPWGKDMEKAAEQAVKFLRDPANKKFLESFFIETYRQFERENIEHLKARWENERKSDNVRIAPHHKSSNITPLVSDELTMNDTERAFARGLGATKKSLVKSVEDRVEEITQLLSGIGGFSANLKSSFARSAVVFLEQEDPKFTFRERLIFSINLPNYELKGNWSKDKEAAPDAAAKGPAKAGAKALPKGRSAPVIDGLDEFGRTAIQATWDEAVNALARIIETTGLKPKFCKNDRHYGRFVMKQDLRSSATLPDEYFSFTLDYNTADKIRDMCVPYDRVMRGYESKIKKLEKKLSRYTEDSISSRYAEIKKRHLKLVHERDFFAATTPDPHQLDEGLLFLIEVSTLKDYHIVKDRMQSIMTKYILHLSTIAEKEAAVDPELGYHLWQKRRGESQGKEAEAAPEKKEPVRVARPASEPKAVYRQYLVDEDELEPYQPENKKKSAA